MLDDPDVKRDLVERLALRSCVVVPITRDGEGIGVPQVQSSRAGPSRSATSRVVGLFAGTVRRRLYKAGEAEARSRAKDADNRYKTVF